MLPKPRPAETEVIIVTLAEETPVYEAMRFEEDLKRANISVKWWVVNSSFAKAVTSNPLPKAKASHKASWIKRISAHSSGNFAVIDWMSDDVKNENLKKLL